MPVHDDATVKKADKNVIPAPFPYQFGHTFGYASGITHFPYFPGRYSAFPHDCNNTRYVFKPVQIGEEKVVDVKTAPQPVYYTNPWMLRGNLLVHHFSFFFWTIICVQICLFGLIRFHRKKFFQFSFFQPTKYKKKILK